LSQKKFWTRGIIKSISTDDKSYFIGIAESVKGVNVKKGSFEIMPLGSMTKDYDWRNNLNAGKYEDVMSLI